MKNFSRSEVKGQSHSETKCTFCGGGRGKLHFNGLASRLTCVKYVKHDKIS